MNYESIQNNKYLNIVKESISGSSQEESYKNYLKMFIINSFRIKQLFFLILYIYGK